MEFFTVYSTKDEHEISILENVFQEEGIKYRVLDTETSDIEDSLQKRIQVAEEDKQKAKELLDQTGFLTVGHPHSEIRRLRGSKFILVFLAMLIILILVILITWFINVNNYME